MIKWSLMGLVWFTSLIPRLLHTKHILLSFTVDCAASEMLLKHLVGIKKLKAEHQYSPSWWYLIMLNDNIWVVKVLGLKVIPRDCWRSTTNKQVYNVYCRNKNIIFCQKWFLNKARQVYNGPRVVDIYLSSKKIIFGQKWFLNKKIKK